MLRGQNRMQERIFFCHKGFMYVYNKINIWSNDYIVKMLKLRATIVKAKDVIAKCNLLIIFYICIAIFYMLFFDAVFR